MKAIHVLLFEFISILLLCIPTFWELYDDQKGDTNKKTDVVIRVCLALVVSVWVYMAGIYAYIMQHGYIQSVVFSLCIHFLIFDYAIAATLGHKDWFSYLGQKGVIDNIGFWRKMGASKRFIVRIVVFSIGLLLYF